jgi:peptidoglycan/LPS O-acetylase OafA/YrhL
MLRRGPRVAVYFALSLGVGIAMSRLIEHPALRLRDRLSPSSQVKREPAVSAAAREATPGVTEPIS